MPDDAQAQEHRPENNGGISQIEDGGPKSAPAEAEEVDHRTTEGDPIKQVAQSAAADE